MRKNSSADRQETPESSDDGWSKNKLPVNEIGVLVENFITDYSNAGFC